MKEHQDGNKNKLLAERAVVTVIQEFFNTPLQLRTNQVNMIDKWAEYTNMSPEIVYVYISFSSFFFLSLPFSFFFLLPLTFPSSLPVVLDKDKARALSLSYSLSVIKLFKA